MGQFLAWLGRTRGLTFADYHALWTWSVDDLDGFWGAVWSYFAIGLGAPTKVLAERTMPGARWFPGVTVNYAEVSLRGEADDVVVIARSQTRAPSELTRGELRAAVARARAGLERLGVRRGDRVAAYMPNIPETLVAMLATTSLGAVWAACSPEFGVESVLDRFRQIEPTVLIAVDGYCYGEKKIDRTAAVASLRAGLPTLRATVGVPYRAAPPDADLTWGELVAVEAAPAYAQVPFDHPLWILFSSGTTGLPKAITHGHGGVAIELAKSAALHGDLGPRDRYFVHCTTSWVMWNLLVGALAVGSAIVLFDGDPNAPDEQTLWQVVAETGATAFACGSTLIVTHRATGYVPRARFDLTKLRSVFCTGSPLPADGFRWIYEAVSETVYLQSSSGGTDVCGAFVGGSPMLPVRAGEIACACLGVRAIALDPAGNPLIGEPGELVIEAPMPSMPIYFWNDPDGAKYRAAYFEMYAGRWRHGDWIVFDEHGACKITGRSDGTLNRGGVRLGTAEFYGVLDAIPSIADALVLHLEDPGGGLGQLLLFVQLAPGAVLDDALRSRVVGELRTRLSPRHVPDAIRAVPAIPYGLTGKKLEVPVKRLLRGEPRAAVISEGAVRDPHALDAFTSESSGGAPLAIAAHHARARS